LKNWCGGEALRRYKYIFSINHSSVSVAEPFSGETGKYEISIPDGAYETIITFADYKEFNKDTANHLGLVVTVELNADDIDRGCVEAKIRANYISVILSFITNATISEPIIELGYEISDTAENTEFIQYYYMNGEELKQKRTMNQSLFDNLGILIMKNGSKRISRAIRWYRMGLHEKDPIDRFMYFWIGLECLNTLLIEELKVSPETDTCKNCGSTYKKPNTTIGIKVLFLNHHKEKSFGFNKCNRLRNELLHGYGDLEDAIGVADKCAESSRNMLLKGIFILLKLGQDILEIYPEPLHNLQMPHIEYRGLFEIAPKNLTTDPCLLIEIRSFEMKYINNQKSISMASRIDANIPDTLRLSGIYFVAEDGLRMQIDGIKTNPKDKG
jgi:hypothetical protein